IYCSSSQAVKQRYRHDRPKAGRYHACKPLSIGVDLTPDALHVVARAGDVDVRRSLPGPFVPVKDPSAMDEAVRRTFAKLGGTRLTLDALDFRNDDRLFVPVSRLNQVRREVISELEKTLDERLQSRIAEVRDAVGRIAIPSHAQGTTPFHWSIKVDRV